MLKGKGLGLRVPHYDYVIKHRPREVDWFEIISENFLYSEGRPLEILQKVREHYPIACHGVGLGLGNLEPTSIDYLQRLKALVDRFQPDIVSDHLCWTSFDSHNSHDLLPVAYTKNQLNHIAEKIDRAQNFLQRKILIENPSAYISFANSDMSESDFIRELCRKTGCQILLDLNNLFVNHNNLGLRIESYFENLSRDSVGQFHVAGHTRRDNLCIDTHDQPICKEVFDIVKTARILWPEVPMLLERDDHIPEWHDLVKELNEVYSITANLKTEPRQEEKKKFSINATQVDDGYKSFFAMMTQRHSIISSDIRLEVIANHLPIPAHVGMNVYNHAYFLRQRDVLKETLPLTFKFLNSENFDYFCYDYLNECPSNEISISKVGANIPLFLANQMQEQKSDFLRLLFDLTRYELAKSEIYDRPFEESNLCVEDLKQFSADDWNNLRFGIKKPFSLLTFISDLPMLLKDIEAGIEITDYSKYTAPSFACIQYLEDQVWWKFCDKDEFKLLAHLEFDGRLSDFFSEKTEQETATSFQKFFAMTSERRITLLDMPR